MAFRVEVTVRAEADIAEAYAYIRKEAPLAADRWVVRLRDCIASLAAIPERCHAAPEAAVVGQELRHLLVGRRWGRTFRLGEPAWVRLVQAERATGGLLLQLIEGEEAPEAPVDWQPALPEPRSVGDRRRRPASGGFRRTGTPGERGRKGKAHRPAKGRRR